MPISEALKRTQAKYKKSLYTIKLEFYKLDADLEEYLKSLDNKQGYIKNLIREDMQKNRNKE